MARRDAGGLHKRNALKHQSLAAVSLADVATAAHRNRDPLWRHRHYGAPLRFAMVQDRATTVAAAAAAEAAEVAAVAAGELSRTGASGHPVAKWSQRTKGSSYTNLNIAARVVEENHSPETLACSRQLLPRPILFPQTHADTIHFCRPDCLGPHNRWGSVSAPTLPKGVTALAPGTLPPSAVTSTAATHAAASAAAAASVLAATPKGAVKPRSELREAGWSKDSLWEYSQRENRLGASGLLQLRPTSASSTGTTDDSGFDGSESMPSPAFNTSRRLSPVGSVGSWGSGSGIDTLGGTAPLAASTRVPEVNTGGSGDEKAAMRPPEVLRHCWVRSRALLRNSSSEVFAGGVRVK